jgi:hypothetical protein
VSEPSDISIDLLFPFLHKIGYSIRVVDFGVETYQKLEQMMQPSHRAQNGYASMLMTSTITLPVHWFPSVDDCGTCKLFSVEEVHDLKSSIETMGLDGVESVVETIKVSHLRAGCLYMVPHFAYV